MSRLSPVLVLAPLAAALAGCTMLEGILPVEDELSLDFQVTEAHGPVLATPEVAVESADGGIVVDVRLSTPDPCRSFEARATTQDGGILLAVRARRNAEVCVGMVGTFEYTAMLSGLDRRVHRLRVTHLIDGRRDPGPHVVFEGDVLVR